MNIIEKFISDKNYSEAVQECMRSNHNHLGILLENIADMSRSQKPSQESMFRTTILNKFKENIHKMKIDGFMVDEVRDVDEKDENPHILESVESVESVDTSSVKPLVKKTRVKLLGNWTSAIELREIWNKMSKGNYTWNNIQVVVDDDPDFFVVINRPPQNENIIPSKTIIFQMEPHMKTKNSFIWGEWASPDPSKFFRICDHDNGYNNNEWHLSKTYNQLKTEVVVKDTSLDNVLSTVMSSKYSDPGTVKRIDFIKFLEKKDLDVHVFGNNKWDYVNYKGGLPPHEKDNGMFPYKYVFNCENNNIKNYYTEKLVDGILAECLVFYSGCYNARDYIDKRAFVYLELSNFENDYKKIKDAIENNMWEERIDIIRKEKQRILDHLQFFPRLERIINGTDDPNLDYCDSAFSK